MGDEAKPRGALLSSTLSDTLGADSEALQVLQIATDKEDTGVSAVQEHATDPFCLSFTGPDDPRQPYAWGRARKWLLFWNVAGLGFSSGLSLLLCTPATSSILADLHTWDTQYATLVVSIWSLGAIPGSLFVGPISELCGRLPVYHVCNVIGLILTIGQTQVTNIKQLLALRFLNGMFIATYALNPAICGDIFVVEERGRAQSLMSLVISISPVLGPVVGGLVAQARGWRWTIWTGFIINAVFAVTMAIQYRETYGPQILRSEAARRRRATNDQRWHSLYDQKESIVRVLARALTRPLRCFTLPIFPLVVFPLGLMTGYDVMLATNLPLVFQQGYHFTEAASGLTFLGHAGGFVIGAVFCSIWLDRYTRSMKARHGGMIKPEWRLPPALVGLVLCPAGLIWYGWSAQARTNPIIPIIATTLSGLGSWMIALPIRSYITDAFGDYRASAMGGAIIINYTCQALLPITAPPLYDRHGFGWGNTILAFIVIAFIPAMFIAIRHGERIRTRYDMEKRLA